MTSEVKRIFILAAPNGAGKTTFAREYLPAEAQCLAFINADLIADGLSPFRPEQAALRAGRLMLELIKQYVARGESFVARRVRQGGHAVPKDVVQRRFASGLGNFEQLYRENVDEWVMLDNSGLEPIILESGGRP